MTALQVDPKARQLVKKAPQLRPRDHEFLPAALEILETPLSPIRATLILTICGFVVASLAWSYIGRVDIIAAAQGKIQPIGRTKTIQPLDTGKVLRLAVENGRKVRAGDTLVATVVLNAQLIMKDVDRSCANSSVVVLKYFTKCEKMLSTPIPLADGLSGSN